MRVLVTRPAPDNARTASRLHGMGHEPVLLPLMELSPLRDPLPDPAHVSALALTSANAVRALAARGDLDAFTALPVFTVGDRTAEAARDAGFAQVKSAHGALEDLAALIARHGISGTVLYPAARQRAGAIRAALGADGPVVATVAVYEMRQVHNAKLAGIDPVPGAALFYSARTAAIFCGLDGADRFAGPCVCISPAVAQTLEEAGHDVRVADAPNEDALFARLDEIARKLGIER